MRKNVFEILNDRENVDFELAKIVKYIFEKPLFTKKGSPYDFDRYTLADLIDNFLISEWKYASIAETVKDIFTLAKFDTKNLVVSSSTMLWNISMEQKINLIEIALNLYKLYCGNSNKLFQKHEIQYLAELDYLGKVLDGTIEKLDLQTKRNKGLYSLHPKNASTDIVIEKVKKENLQWELLDYDSPKHKNNLIEKRKKLALFATEFCLVDSIEKPKNNYLAQMLNDCNMILNTLHIRHNNETGKWKNQIIQNMTEAEAIQWCDIAYNLIIAILHARDQEKDFDLVKGLRLSSKNSNKQAN